MLIFISMKKNWGKEKRSKSSCVDWDMLGFQLTLWTNYLGLIGFLPSLRSDGIICHYTFLTTVFINKPTISMSFQKHDWTFLEGKPLLGATHFPEVGVILPFLCKRYLPRGVERSHTLHIEQVTAGGLSPWFPPGLCPLHHSTMMVSFQTCLILRWANRGSTATSFSWDWASSPMN